MANTLVIKKCASGFIVEVLGGTPAPAPPVARDSYHNVHAFEKLSSVLTFIKGNYAEEQHRGLLERGDITATEVLKRQMAACPPAAPAQPAPKPLNSCKTSKSPAAPAQPAPAPVKPYRGPASDW
jgi:hypothetical protein